MIRNLLLKIACKILEHYNLSIPIYEGNTFIFNNKIFKIIKVEYKAEQGCLDEIDIKCYEKIKDLFKNHYMQEPIFERRDN